MPRPSPLGPPLLLLTFVLAATPGATQQSAETPPEVILGKRSEIRLLEAPADQVLVTTGTRLYALPDRRSTLVDIVGADAPLPVLERASDWVRVRVLGRSGWAAVADGKTGPEIEALPDLDYLATRSEPLRPSPERLRRALALLGGGGGVEAGPFTLYSDLDDPAAIDWLAALVAQVPAVYEARYGLEIWPHDRFAVVVFAAESSYRAFERHDRELAVLESSGHAAGNIAALYADDRRPRELGPILLHELTHLLNRSSFRGSLPAWLEEGLAEDLSFSRIDRSGRIDPKRLGGVDRSYLEFNPNGSRTYITEVWGAPATLERLVAAQRANRLLPLVDLLALSRREMVRIEGRPLRYGQSAFLVRYLLDGAGETGREGLRRFLDQAAEGGGVEPDDLTRWVERDWNQLTRGFERWLVVRQRGLAAGP